MTSPRRLAALVLLGLATAAPAAQAQSLNDLGRVLQDQVLGNRGNDPNREREAYERGRQDQADQLRRERDDRQRAGDDRRRFDDGDRRRRFDDNDRRQHDVDRQRADAQRARDDEDRARAQSRRY